MIGHPVEHPVGNRVSRGFQVQPLQPREIDGPAAIRQRAARQDPTRQGLAQLFSTSRSTPGKPRRDIRPYLR